MPIIASPAAEPSTPCCDKPLTEVVPTPVSCADLAVVTPGIALQHRQQVLGRMQAVRVRAGQNAAIEWTLRAADGSPVDLSACGFTDSSDSVAEPPLVKQLVLRLREAVTRSKCFVERAGTVVDAETGKVSFQLLAVDVKYAGVYLGEAALVSVEGNDQQVIHSNVFYLHVERGLHAAKPHGPPSIAEIRLHLRDSAPGENMLLDAYKWDDAEIAAAITRPVDYWNEVPPDIGRFTTASFPFRFHWLEAICGNLFLFAAEYFRANQLDYQAGGVTVNDMNKERNYEAAAERRLLEWRTFVRAKKAAINLEGAYGGIGSQYGR